MLHFTHTEGRQQTHTYYLENFKKINTKKRNLVNVTVNKNKQKNPSISIYSSEISISKGFYT